ncbi:MAG: DNA repair protein RecO [Ignavibacteriales bacterium CG07_land_8_20_14_0_80_59_12]|nr:MAG: DNA repair protein RecO [Ignavibacteriales bacterium CG07_land_8_20_14_0_80_59_12]
MVLMPLVKTEAIVLRTMNYRETSKIATLYTRDYGKIRVLAKGIRRQKGGYGGASLDALTCDTIVFSYREGRSLLTLAQADILDPYLSLKESYEAISTAWQIIELVDRSLHDGEPNLRLYELLREALAQLKCERTHFEPVLFAFEIAFAESLGFALQFEGCIHCGEPLRFGGGKPGGFIFSPVLGGFTGPECSSEHAAGTKVSPGAVRSLQHLKEEGVAAAHIRFTLPVSNEIDALLSHFLRYHVDELDRPPASKQRRKNSAAGSASQDLHMRR